MRRLLPVLILVAIMWALELVDVLLRGSLDNYGIESREVDGLTGVVAAPFLHGGFAHLMANTVPFLVLGGLVSLRYYDRFWPITAVIVVGSGLGVWLIGPGNAVTIGASGVVFGYLTFLLTAGVLTRHWLDVLIGLGVLFIYGGFLMGALPWGVEAGVSWQAHLMGALAGVVAALWFARSRQAALPQYAAQ